MERASFTEKVRRKWSVMGSSAAVRLMGVTPEQQIRSKI